MPAIQPPVFGDALFDVRAFGAVDDGKTANTGAFRAAIEACAEAGGTVQVPAGEWLTGPIHLRSRVRLHLAAGAVVRFSTRFADYLPVIFTRWEGHECYNYSPLIYAHGCTDIAVTGSGTIGWGWPSPHPAYPNFVMTTLINLANVNNIDNKPIARRVDDDPALGLWADNTGVIFGPFLNASHYRPFYVSPGGNPNNFGVVPDNDSKVGRNLARLGGDVNFARFTDQKMKFNLQFESAQWIGF